MKLAGRDTGRGDRGRLVQVAAGGVVVAGAAVAVAAAPSAFAAGEPVNIRLTTRCRAGRAPAAPTRNGP